MDTDNIVIYEKDLISAQRICASIEDSEKRNKAVANVIAAKIAAEYFDSSSYDLDISSGLHNVVPFIEEYEISDLYVNNAYIDVRVYFSDDEMCVPKIHFDIDVLPVAYMFIKLSPDVKNATVTGFIYPERVNKENLKDNAYFISQDDLSSFYDVEMRLHPSSDIKSAEDLQIYEYIDGTMDSQCKNELIKILVSSKHSRIRFIKAVTAQSVFNFISTPVIEDSVVENSETQPVEINNNPVQEGTSINEDELDLSDEELDNLFSDDDNSDVSDNDSVSDKQEYETEVTPSGAEVIQSLDEEQNNEEDASNNTDEIETLFDGEQEGVPVGNKKKNAFIPLLVLVLLICGGGYFWYNMFFNSNKDNSLPSPSEVSDISADAQADNLDEETNQQTEQDAMPVETVENLSQVNNKEESTAVAIPAIERNLDASVLVSNLKIDWEVPEGYASNTAAKRYLIKLGKVIQLDLKTELLLLNKPPLSNKITVELKYNVNSSKFEVVGIQMSSGEKSVDDVILKTVSSALSMGISTNMESFGKLQGNPVLIIHL